MRILLDTHCWLWWLGDHDRLNARAKGLLTDRSNEIYFSAASVWEISIKVSIGKLTLPEAPRTFIPDRLRQQNMRPLAITLEHAVVVTDLPYHHKDPFDRILVAQAMADGLTLLTADGALKPYNVDQIWAGA